jgi:hypothetical protein
MNTFFFKYLLAETQSWEHRGENLEGLWEDFLLEIGVKKKDIPTYLGPFDDDFVGPTKTKAGHIRIYGSSYGKCGNRYSHTITIDPETLEVEVKVR